MAPVQGADGHDLQQGCIAGCLLLGSTVLLDPFWGHVLRQTLLFVVSSVLLWAMTSIQGTLRSTYELLDNLLGNMCDGYVILRHDGSVAYADPMSTDTLGLVASDSSSGAVQNDAFGGGSGVVMGLRTHRMTVRGKRLEVETYTIPCPPLLQGLPSIFLRGLKAPPPLAAEGLRYLCTIRIRQEHADGEKNGQQQSQNRPLARSRTAPAMTPPVREMPSTPTVKEAGQDTPATGGILQGSQAILQAGKKNIIKQEFSVDAEALSDLCSVLQPAGGQAAPGQEEEKETLYQLPGTAWQAIQAVGIGVGNYKKVRMIARGGQGSIWQVISQDGIKYAEKDIFLKGRLWHVDFPKRLKDADREVRALKGLSWASCVIVPIIDCWIQNDFEQACIVMEWLPSNMDQVLKQYRRDKEKVPLLTAIDWLGSLAVGVAAIHWAGFIHRDLKAANILLDENRQRCKIADLGVSRPLHRTNSSTSPNEREELSSQLSVRSEKTKLSMATSVEPGSILSGYTARPGTNAYTSPEALEGSAYGTSSDIFSLGCVVLEVLTLEDAPDVSVGCVESAMPMMALRLLGPPRPRDESPERKIADLCLRMLNSSASERPSAQMVATHPLLRRHVEKLMQECSRLRAVLAP